MCTDPILKVEHVSKAFGKGEAYLKVLDDVSLEVGKGEFASLMGPSGSGKSTLLYIIGGLDIEYEGNIYIGGQKMTGMKDEAQSALRLSKIGFIFQFYNLVQNLSVEDNILLPVKMAGKKVDGCREKLEEILEITGLAEKKKISRRNCPAGQRETDRISKGISLCNTGEKVLKYNLVRILQWGRGGYEYETGGWRRKPDTRKDTGPSGKA